MDKQKAYLKIKKIADSVWGVIRKQIVARKHKKIAEFWQPIILDYFDGKVEKIELQPKQKLNDKIIWQFWAQQDENIDLPAIVQRSFESVDKYKGDYQVIRLNDKNIEDYLEFPDFIYKDKNETKFSKVFFSDLLRLALLKVYGGIWLDATVLLTAPLSKEFIEQDYFVFQRSNEVKDKSFWAGPHTNYWGWDPRYRVKMLNSIIFAKKDSVMIATMFHLILHYWKTQDKIINYFFFQILYHELVNDKLKDTQCTVVSDTLPHILRVLADGNTNYMSMQELANKVNIHKLTYFDDDRIARLDELLSQLDQNK